LERLPSYESSSPDGGFYLDQVYQLLRTHYSKKGFTETNINADRNNKDNAYGRMAHNFNTGIRSGVTHTYLQTAKARSNFKLVLWTYAKSLVRGGTNGARITGVKTNNTVDFPDGVATLKPAGRVILSGGCFGTARLLFTSGIGPSDMIKLVESSSSANLLPPSSQYINLPVGYYASDNPGITVRYGINNN
jgi:cellobiose dehydrogenase (acceptor)